MARFTIDQRMEEAELDFFSTIIDKIIEMSGGSGHNVEIEFNSEEWRVLHLHHPRMHNVKICEMYYFGLLRKLREIHGKNYSGFHWVFTGKGFRTFDCGEEEYKRRQAS